MGLGESRFEAWKRAEAFAQDLEARVTAKLLNPVGPPATSEDLSELREHRRRANVLMREMLDAMREAVRSLRSHQ